MYFSGKYVTSHTPLGAAAASAATSAYTQSKTVLFPYSLLIKMKGLGGWDTVKLRWATTTKICSTNLHHPITRKHFPLLSCLSQRKITHVFLYYIINKFIYIHFIFNKYKTFSVLIYTVISTRVGIGEQEISTSVNDITVYQCRKNVLYFYNIAQRNIKKEIFRCFRVDIELYEHNS